MGMPIGIDGCKVCEDEWIELPAQVLTPTAEIELLPPPTPFSWQAHATASAAIVTVRPCLSPWHSSREDGGRSGSRDANQWDKGIWDDRSFALINQFSSSLSIKELSPLLLDQ